MECFLYCLKNDKQPFHKAQQNTMELIHQIFGEGKDLTALQMTCRAVVIFLVTLILIRISGMRSFGMKSAFDNIIVIMLGAIMSRPVVGASAFMPTIAAGLTIAVVHRLLAWIGFHNKGINHAIRGSFFNLFKDGKFNDDSLRKCNLTVEEVMGHVRADIHDDKLENVREINMERSGQLSIIKKNT
jgi:uncharacterized membrane protein YcaP (DUF421 family)